MELNRDYRINPANGFKLLDPESIDCIITSIPQYFNSGKETELFVREICDIIQTGYRSLKQSGSIWVNVKDGFYTSGIKKVKQFYRIPEKFAVDMISRGWILRNRITLAGPEVIYFFTKGTVYFFNNQPELSVYSVKQTETPDLISVNTGTMKAKGYPEQLIVPCLLAGCPEGGVVVDPFASSDLVGRTAVRYRRNYIGFNNLQ